MWYVYVLQSQKNGHLYTGSTKDLKKRFDQHQSGKSFWTKSRGPFKLVYYEACTVEGDARKREVYLKSGMGKRYLKTRLNHFLELNGYESR